MKKLPGIILRIIFFLVMAFMIYIAVILIFNSILDYNPQKTSLAGNGALCPPDTIATDTLAIISWNIGYGGLGEDADFFYDGGTMVYPDEEYYARTFEGILNRLNAFSHIPFIVLQEVDMAAARSYYQNQYLAIDRRLNNHYGYFAPNYDVVFVPLPLARPLGKVYSGLSVFSSPCADSAVLIPFPGNYSWPKKLFMPDRCFMINTYPTENGKKLHIVNTHNSAFDQGKLRAQQLRMLYDLMEYYYAKGDYMIISGDWNVNPPGYENIPFVSGDPSFDVPFNVPAHLAGKDMILGFDPQYPTNRKLTAKYIHGSTKTTIIDYYLCSPNVEVLDVRTLNDGFRYSDHQPVYMLFRLMTN